MSNTTVTRSPPYLPENCLSHFHIDESWVDPRNTVANKQRFELEINRTSQCVDIQIASFYLVFHYIAPWSIRSNLLEQKVKYINISLKIVHLNYNLNLPNSLHEVRAHSKNKTRRTVGWTALRQYLQQDYPHLFFKQFSKTHIFIHAIRLFFFKQNKSNSPNERPASDNLKSTDQIQCLKPLIRNKHNPVTNSRTRLAITSNVFLDQAWITTGMLPQPNVDIQ